MSRAPSTTDFHVDVDGVGHFVFARRTMRDELRIQAEYSRLTEGVDNPSVYLDRLASWIAVVKVLKVDAPHGWDPETLDPYDEGTLDKIRNVFNALRIKEDSFRPKPAGSEAGGAGAIGEAELLVPAQVQPAAQGSALS